MPRSKEYFEYFVYTIDQTTLNASDGTAFTDKTIKIDTDTHFELFSRSHVATSSKIYVQFKDDASRGGYYNSGKMDLRNISADHNGSVLPVFFKPFELTQPLILRGGSNFTSNFSDFSGSVNSIRLALHGSKVKQGPAPWERKYQQYLVFDYSLNMTVGANQTASAVLNIDNDTDFLVKKITGTRSGSCTVLVTSTANNQAWMNLPIHFDNLVGNALFPNILVSPRFLHRGSGIDIIIQDLSGSSNNVTLNFHGKKLLT